MIDPVLAAALGRALETALQKRPPDNASLQLDLFRLNLRTTLQGALIAALYFEVDDAVRMSAAMEVAARVAAALQQANALPEQARQIAEQEMAAIIESLGDRARQQYADRQPDLRPGGAKPAP